MAINQIKVKLNRDVPVSRLEHVLEIGNSNEKGDIGVEKLRIRFNEHFHIEVKQNKKGDVIITMTSGGISKEIDIQTFQQLVTMNY